MPQYPDQVFKPRKIRSIIPPILPCCWIFFFGWFFILVFDWIAYDADALMPSSRYLELFEYCLWQTLCGANP